MAFSVQTLKAKTEPLILEYVWGYGWHIEIRSF